MYYVYKTINKVNNKYYIGVHQSDDMENDPYLGSGTILKKAIKKYGRENFYRIILHQTDSKEEAYSIEKSLVVINENSYNVNTGGEGSFDYVRSLNLPNPMKDERVKRK